MGKTRLNPAGRQHSAVISALAKRQTRPGKNPSPLDNSSRTNKFAGQGGVD